MEQNNQYPPLPEREPQKKALFYNHPVGLRHLPCIRAVRAKFKNEGVAVVFYLLEVLANSEDFTFSLNHKTMQQLLLDFEIEEQFFREMITFCTSDAIDIFQRYQNGTAEGMYLRSSLLEEDLLGSLKAQRARVKKAVGRYRDKKGKEGRKVPTPSGPKYKAKPKDIAMVAKYMRERGIIPNPEMEAKKFYDYYEGCGWIYGEHKKQIKDWKAIVRTTWESKYEESSVSSKSPGDYDRNNPRED